MFLSIFFSFLLLLENEKFSISKCVRWQLKVDYRNGVFGLLLYFLKRWQHSFDNAIRKPKDDNLGTSLVGLWLRIHLPMQGTRVQALVREDPTCCRATKPMHHNYWACALEPASHNYWAHVPQLLKPMRLEPVLRSKRSHLNEKPAHCNKE